MIIFIDLTQNFNKIMAMKLTLSLLLVTASVAGSELPDNFVRAIHLTESSGRLGAIIGDNGKAYGPLQIHRDCWRDSRVKGDYRDCADLFYSKRVMSGYLQRFCPAAVASNDFETMARVWNGGPMGYKNSATLGYWHKVKSNLK